MTTTTLPTAAAPNLTAASGHPKALPMLFLTEMWERFSYYGMRALLVLYLVNALHYDRKDALALYGLYTGLVYLTPIIGGYLADRYLGRRKAILIMLEAHSTGRAVVIVCPQEQAEFYAERLGTYGLTVTIERAND